MSSNNSRKGGAATSASGTASQSGKKSAAPQQGIGTGTATEMGTATTGLDDAESPSLLSFAEVLPEEVSLPHISCLYILRRLDC